MHTTLRACLASLFAFASLWLPAMAAPPTMQAIVQTAGLEISGLKLQTVDTPQPGPNQVLIKVHAAAVNPVDWKRPAPTVGPSKAAIPGHDVAGVIDTLGPGVSGFKPGEAVFSRVSGAYAQYAVADADLLVRKPQRFSFEQAAGIPVAGAAGFHAVEAVKLQPGQKVAVIGAAGGAGSTAVEVARAQGARVTGIGHSSQADFLRKLGVEEFVAYDRDDVAARVKDMDAVLNMVDGQATPGLRYLRRGGALASIAGPADAAACSAGGFRCVQIGPAYRSELSMGDTLRALARLADEGKHTVHVTRTFPLAQAAEAQAFVRNGDTMGKVVLVVGQ